MTAPFFDLNKINRHLVEVLIMNLNMTLEHIEYVEESYGSVTNVAESMFYQLYGNKYLDEYRNNYKPYLDIIKKAISDLKNEFEKHQVK